MILRPEVLLALVMDVPLASRAARSVTGDHRSAAYLFVFGSFHASY